jgi:hypothetical protein
VFIETSAISAAAPTASTQEHAKYSIPFEKRELGCGLVEFVISDAKNRLKDVFRIAAKCGTLYAAINEMRLSQRKVSGWTASGDDLFALAPSEIRLENSLRIGPVTVSEASIEDWLAVYLLDAAVLFVSNSSLADLHVHQKLGWAWYSRPSILRQQLTHGSETLAKTLLSVIELVIVSTGDSSSITLITKKDVSEQVSSELLLINNQLVSSD